jgi:putative nucleotidyltransferase with HDIG domain
MTQQRISIDQLRVGLYVQLEGWMDHPFLFSSFKIKNQQQINALQSLGLKDIVWVRDKSDYPPLPAQPQVEPKAEQPAPDPAVQAMWAEKKARREKLSQQREAFGRCEKRFNSGMSTVKSLLGSLFSRPQESVQQAREVVAEMVDSLLAEKDVLLHLMNAKSGDEGAYYHALNVSMLSLMLAKEAGFCEQEMHDLGLGCLLHDMGKERVPSQILLKRTPWTTAETNFYQQHVVYGMDMAQKLPTLPSGALEVIAMHHECLDGSGYPGKLKADRIGKFARIAAIANTYDNLCNRINPADSMTPAEALSHMFKREQGRYDLQYMQFFIRCLGVYPPGSIVRLNNDSIGLVVSVNPGLLLHPTLLIYDPDIPKEEALMLDLAEEEDLSVVATLRPGSLDKAVFDYLSPRSRISYYTDGSRPKDEKKT